MSYSVGDPGENIIEVRPRAGAHVWSNRNAANPNAGPGELVVPVITPPVSRGQYTSAGEAYFLFTGGRGRARVNEWGETDGSVE